MGGGGENLDKDNGKRRKRIYNYRRREIAEKAGEKINGREEEKE